MSNKCILIGNPVAHSISPKLHEVIGKHTGFDYTYEKNKLETEEVLPFVKDKYENGVLGFNVTIPHKQTVMGALCDIDTAAKEIGAVNTLVRTEEGYKGYNTDMPGLYRALQYDGLSIEGKNCILIGAGGVSRAVAVMAAKYGVEKLYILNRSVDKAEELARLANASGKREFAVALPLDGYKSIKEDIYVAFQGTSVGMHPNIEDIVIDDPYFYDKVQNGYDLIYNPSVTKFEKQFLSRGKKAFNGLRMLIFQGIIAFELWSGLQVSKEVSDLIVTEIENE